MSKLLKVDNDGNVSLKPLSYFENQFQNLRNEISRIDTLLNSELKLSSHPRIPISDRLSSLEQNLIDEVDRLDTRINTSNNNLIVYKNAKKIIHLDDGTIDIDPYIISCI
tara:strand:- start:5368 stop:5697 length:330 start_codon:yes stop_codon:yes gene_type:complete